MWRRALTVGLAAFTVLTSGCVRFQRDEALHHAANDHDLSSAIRSAFDCAQTMECEVPAGLELLLVSWGEWALYSLELYRDGTVKFVGGPSQACSGAYVGRIEPEAVSAPSDLSRETSSHSSASRTATSGIRPWCGCGCVPEATGSSSRTLLPGPTKDGSPR